MSLANIDVYQGLSPQKRTRIGKELRMYVRELTSLRQELADLRRFLPWSRRPFTYQKETGKGSGKWREVKELVWVELQQFNESEEIEMRAMMVGSRIKVLKEKIRSKEREDIVQKSRKQLLAEIE